MSKPGPIPKRVAERAGHRSREERESVTVVEIRDGVKIPAADTGWHRIAHNLYAAAIQSGQSKWYEPTDWQMLHLICDELTEHLNGKRSAMKLQVLNQMLSNLLMTEADRRRVNMEVERHQTKDTSDEEASALYAEYGV